MEPKPIVYIDLIGTLALRYPKEESRKNLPSSHIASHIDPDPDQNELGNSNKLHYTDHKVVRGKLTTREILQQPHEKTAESNLYEVALLENYIEILNELRQKCDLRLISNINRFETLLINEEFNLGFDKRTTLASEDILSGDYNPTNDPLLTSNYSFCTPLCPEAILISNAPKNSKNSIIQRQSLGIEKEQQVNLHMLEIKSLNYPDQNKCANSNKSYMPIKDLAEILGTEDKSKSFKPNVYTYKEEFGEIS